MVTNQGYYLLGDSTYALEPFTLLPYDSPSPKTTKDNFNFYDSSVRITIESESWKLPYSGVFFWKKLKCSLGNAAIIIERSTRMHILLADYR